MTTSALVAQYIERALTAHGIASVSQNDIVSPGDPNVGFRGDYAVNSSNGETVVVLLSIAATGPILGGQVIWERFAGVGADEHRALADGFGKFLRTSFHVLLNTLTDHRCEQDGTEWSDWNGDAGNWRACDSALLVQGGADPVALAKAPFFEDIRATFLKTAAPGVHWVSVFFAFLNGDRSAVEIKLDGQDWAAGLAAWERATFDMGTGYISGRYFFIALPRAADGAALSFWQRWRGRSASKT